MKKYAFIVLSWVALFAATPFSEVAGQALSGSSLDVSGTGTINTLVSGSAFITSGSIGSLVVGGSADIVGNSLYFGSWEGDPTHPGWSIAYNDGASGTNASVTQTLTRPQAVWNWQRSTASGSVAAVMQIDASNRLILTGTGTNQLVLDPNGTVSVGGCNLLTQSAADSRYVVNSGTGSATLANTTISGMATINGGLAISGTATMNGSSLLTQIAANALYLSASAGLSATNGKVGIGTTNPIGILHVVGDSSATKWLGLFAQAGISPENSSTASTVQNKMLSVQGDNGAFFMGRDVTNDIEFVMGVSSLHETFAGTMTNNNFSLRTNNLSRLTVDTNGNVGIGTTSPVAKTEIVGGVDATSSTILQLRSNYTSTETGSYINFVNSTDPDNMVSSGKIGVIRRASAADMDFQLGNTSPSTKLYIVGATGNVGIGTKAPSSALSFSNDADKTIGVERGGARNLTISAGGASVGATDASGGNLTFASGMSTGNGSNGSIKFQTSSGGTSGTADNSLRTRLTISGAGVYIGSGAGSGYVYAGCGGLDVAWGGVPGTLLLGAEVNLTTRTNNTLKLFSIAGAPYSTSEEAVAVLAGRSDYNYNELDWGGGGSALNAATVQNFYTAANNTTTGGTLRMTINSSGNVGIGTSAPQSKLDVSGDAKISGTLAISGSGSLKLPDGTVISGSNTLKSVMSSGTALAISGTLPSTQVAGLAAVATTGNYSSLLGLPTIPTDNSQLANGAGFITSSGTAAYALASASSAVLTGTIQASQVEGMAAVATGGSLDYSKVSDAPTNVSAFVNDAGYIVSGGTGNNITMSGTTNVIGQQNVAGKLLVTGTMALPDGTVLSGSDTLRNFVIGVAGTVFSGTIPASQVTGLAPVASTGQYSSLTGLPTIPTDNAQLANGAGYITSTGTAAYAFSSGTAMALTGTIQASQVTGLASVATGGNLDYSKLLNAPNSLSAFTNDAGFIVASGTAANLTLSGTSKTVGVVRVSGGMVVTGTLDSAINTIVASGTSQQLLIPQQGDLLMGDFTAGAKPQ